MRRRTFLGAAALAAGATRAPRALAQPAPARRFPEGFVWGVSTSAYQIEGAVAEDGRGESVWDVFCRKPGAIQDGASGAIACDHYHRVEEDVALIAGAGLGAYRFSVAWPRVIPEGTGAINAKGLDFYDRLVDSLLKRNIEPWACLYHWDLPQPLQERGGWTERGIADAFTGYALVVAGRLGDRVRHWAMLNEPSVVAYFGHGIGTHAPGLTGREPCLAALHHQNLAQGRALAALRASARPQWKLGTVVNAQPVRPASGLEANQPAASLWDALWNRAALDPLFLGRYPALLEEQFAPWVKAGDLEAIRQPVDFLGLNYYSPMFQQADPGGLFGTGFGPSPPGMPSTAMGWPVDPGGLVEILLDIRDRYGNPAIHVAENGADYYDWIGPEGKAEDGARIAYLDGHLRAALDALDKGANLKGWMVWTLLDNFEWSDGYRRHFGLVAVDRATFRRTPKASYHWYADVVRRNGLLA